MGFFRGPRARLVPYCMLAILFAGCANSAKRPASPRDESARGSPAPTGSADSSGPLAELPDAPDPGEIPVVDPAAPRQADKVPEKPQSPDRPNALAPGFLIKLSHQEDRDLNGSFRIGFDGRLELPYNVVLKADGLTMEELRQKILEAYRPFYKGGLRLSVELAEKSYFVELRGLIQKPGRLRLRADASLDEVIAQGGGFPTGAENQPRFLKITRGEQESIVNLDDYYKSGALKATSNWRGGEILFFQKESVYTDFGAQSGGTAVQVLGELKRPGEFAHRSGSDVFFYMAEAGGPTRDADFFKVQIFRGPPGQRTMTEFTLEEPEKVPAVLPGDILVFQADKQTPFQKKVGTAANIASILTAIALIILAL